MQIRDEQNDLTVELTYDADGFPRVRIDTGGGFHDEHQRPTVDVDLNGVRIHDMFDEDDTRWDRTGPAS